jgi:hypothetical protein
MKMAKKKRTPTNPDYDIGRGRPPAHSRWKPGQSGNPGGRPKGRLSQGALLRRILNENRLRRHEVWRHAYLADPYLLGAPDDRVAKRFCDIFMNTTELGPDGKIGTHDIAKDDTWMQKFTHILEEYGSRNGTPIEVTRQLKTALQPVFLKIGSLKDFADLILV